MRSFRSDRLAAKHGLEEVDRKTFNDFFACYYDSLESRRLMERMSALEVTLVRSVDQDLTSIEFSSVTD